MRIIPVLVVLLILAACSPATNTPSGENTQHIEIDEVPERPIFERSDPPEDSVYQPTENNPDAPSGYLKNKSVFLQRAEGATQVRLPLNYPLGWAYPVLTLNEIPLLRPAPVQTGNTFFRGYRQGIRLEFNGTGNITYTTDDIRDGEYIGTEMQFAEGEPYYAYSVVLSDRPFFAPSIVGSDILLLGSTYQIMESTNFTLQLNGKNVEQYLRISNDEKLESNRKKVDDSKVFYDGLGFTYTLYAPDLDEDGFSLRAGESLRDRLAEEKREESIVGQHFDIRYDGLEPIEPELIREIIFDVKDDHVQLKWATPNAQVKLPLLGLNEDGILWHGNSETRVHFKECEDRYTGCVYEEDQIILFGRLPDGTFQTRLLEISGFDADEKKIMFRDAETRERISTDWDGNVSGHREPAIAHIDFLDHRYVLYIHGEENEIVPHPHYDNETWERRIPNSISIDLDGNGGIRGDEVPLIVDYGVEVIVDVLPNETLDTYRMNVTLEAGNFWGTQRQYYDGIINREEISIQVVYDGNRFFVEVPIRDEKLWDQRLQVDFDDDFASGMSPWGTLAVLDYDLGSNQRTADELMLTIPVVQRFGLVSIGELK